MVFNEKNTKEPITHYVVPNQNWKKFYVDLYGPIPSNKRVVVVQHLASRYPAIKLMKSTKADAVLPVLEDIYDTFGNPQIQLPIMDCHSLGRKWLSWQIGGI